MKSGIFKGIGPNILIVGVVSLLTDLSSQMVFPLIPLFMTTSLGAGAWAVGIVEGAAETTAALLKVVSGFWSDKIRRRKPFILYGYALSGITKPLFAFTQAWPLVLGVRVIERIGKGLRNAPRDAIVAESCDENARGKAYGIQRTMDGLGSVFGAVAGAALLPLLGFEKVFLWAFLPSVLAVVAILWIREKPTTPEEQTKKITVRGSFRELPGNLRLFIVASSIFALGHFGYAFLLLRARSIGGLGDVRAIQLYAFFYVVYSIVSIPAGMLSDRIGRKAVLLIGTFLFACTSLSLIYAHTVWQVIGAFALYGVFYAIIDGGQKAFVVDLCPRHLKATALGAFYTSIGLVALPGGFIAGLIWEKISPEATFLFGLGLAAISFVTLLFVKVPTPAVSKA